MADRGIHDELSVHGMYEQNVEKIIAKSDGCFLKCASTILFLAYCAYQQILQLTFSHVVSHYVPA